MAKTKWNRQRRIGIDSALRIDSLQAQHQVVIPYQERYDFLEKKDSDKSISLYFTVHDFAEGQGANFIYLIGSAKDGLNLTSNTQENQVGWQAGIDKATRKLFLWEGYWGGSGVKGNSNLFNETIVAGITYHLVISRKRTEPNVPVCYLNKVKLTSENRYNSLQADFLTHHPICIGSQTGLVDGGNAVKGIVSVSHVALFNAVLTAADVENIHQRGGILPENLHISCVGYWPCQETSGNNLFDAVEQFNYAKIYGTEILTNTHFLDGLTGWDPVTDANSTITLVEEGVSLVIHNAPSTCVLQYFIESQLENLEIGVDVLKLDQNAFVYFYNNEGVFSGAITLHVGQNKISVPAGIKYRLSIVNNADGELIVKSVSLRQKANGANIKFNLAPNPATLINYDAPEVIIDPAIPNQALNNATGWTTYPGGSGQFGQFIFANGTISLGTQGGDRYRALTTFINGGKSNYDGAKLELSFRITEAFNNAAGIWWHLPVRNIVVGLPAYTEVGTYTISTILPRNTEVGADSPELLVLYAGQGCTTGKIADLNVRVTNKAVPDLTQTNALTNHPGFYSKQGNITRGVKGYMYNSLYCKSAVTITAAEWQSLYYQKTDMLYYIDFRTPKIWTLNDDFLFGTAADNTNLSLRFNSGGVTINAVPNEKPTYRNFTVYKNSGDLFLPKTDTRYKVLLHYRAGQVLEMYINGEKMSTSFKLDATTNYGGAFTFPMNTTGVPFGVGAAYIPYSYGGWTGSINEFASIYNSTLTEEQKQDLTYLANDTSLISMQEGLRLQHFRLQDNNGTVVYDRSGRNITPTLFEYGNTLTDESAYVEVKSGLPVIKKAIPAPGLANKINLPTNIPGIGTNNFSLYFTIHFNKDVVPNDGLFYEMDCAGASFRFYKGQLVIFLSHVYYMVVLVPTEIDKMSKGFYSICIQKIGERNFRAFINGRKVIMANAGTGFVDTQYMVENNDIFLTNISNNSFYSNSSDLHLVNYGVYKGNLTLKELAGLHNNSLFNNPKSLKDWACYYQFNSAGTAWPDKTGNCTDATCTVSVPTLAIDSLR